jgi:hypothetical protein
VGSGRTATLTRYGLGCLDLAAASSHLTGTGQLIFQRLKEAL